MSVSHLGQVAETAVQVSHHCDDTLSRRAGDALPNRVRVRGRDGVRVGDRVRDGDVDRHRE